MMDRREHRRQKALDFVVAYSVGPTKLGHATAPELMALRARWLGVAAASVEAALQNRADEEGSGPLFAALKFQKEHFA
jgi:hypothetical protein